MDTVLNTLFVTELTAKRRALLIDAAAKLFPEHWTVVAGEKILVPDHDSLELLTCTCTEWHTDMFWAGALAAHGTKLQAHVASLEEQITNTTEEQTTSGPTDSFSNGGGPATSNPTMQNASHPCLDGSNLRRITWSAD